MGQNVEEAAPEFAAELTNGEPDEFAVVTGEQVQYEGGKSSEERTAELLKRVGYQLEDPSKIRNLATERGWDSLEADGIEGIRSYLADQLEADPLFRLLQRPLA